MSRLKQPPKKSQAEKKKKSQPLPGNLKVDLTTWFFEMTTSLCPIQKGSKI